MTVRANKPAFNVRKKLKELERPIGVKGNELMRAETVQDARDLVSAGRKNLIINGGFEISQRGDYSSNTSTGQNEYRIDRWKHLVRVVTANTRRDLNQTIDGQLMNVWRIEATSTGTGAIGIRQYIEATSTGRVPTAGRQTTLSVWMRSNNPNAGIYVYDYSISGYPQRFDWHSGSGRWEKLSITFTAGTGSVTANGYALELNFSCTTSSNGNVSINSGDYIEIAQPQLEVGKNATEFEHRSEGEELALCQRYFYSSRRDGNGGSNAFKLGYTGIGYGNYAIHGMRTFPVQMRVAPTITAYAYGFNADFTTFGDERTGTLVQYWYTGNVGYVTHTYGLSFATTPDAIVLVNNGENTNTDRQYQCAIEASAEL